MRPISARAALGFSLLCFLLLPTRAGAQDAVRATLESGGGSSAEFTLTNPFEFEVHAVNVRVTYQGDDLSDRHYYSQSGWSAAIAGQGEWSGSLNFADSSGAAPPAELDWTGYDRLSVGAGVDVPAFSETVAAALEGGNDVIADLLPTARQRAAVVARASIHHEGHTGGSDVPAAFFDRDRMDGLVTQLEDALCESASQQLLAASGSRREEVYEELTPWMREQGLHINCINSEAKLAAARMLIAGSRPQDALLFKETDEEGNLLPEWEPIYIEANLALARTAAELDVQAYSSIRPALEALNNVHDIAPDNEQLAAVAAILVPNAAEWVIGASGQMNRDLPNAMAALQMLRPRWTDIPKVEEAAAAFATTLIEDGLEKCRRREYINARNQFIRGERILEGVPAWDSRADEINHCRALGALAEGREEANHPTDEEGPERGYRRLEEAIGRFELAEEEISEFEADIAQAYVNVAVRQIEDYRHPAAMASLREAEEVSPTGRTDAIREAWILYAETMYEREGITMRGADIEEARAALEKAEDVDEARISAIRGKLTTAYYSYRVGIPGAALFLGLLALGFHLNSKRKAKKYAELSEDSF